jgi:hypothetical protein
MQHLYQRLRTIARRLGHFRNSALVTATAASVLIGGSTAGVAQSAPPDMGENFEPPYTAGPVWQAPPPARSELMPLALRPGWIWSPGYWRWTGRNYIWIEGRWLPLRSGFRYIPAHWEQVGGAWLFVPARWVRRSAFVAP